MISIVAQGINGCVDIVLAVLAVSANIGQAIVTVLAGACSFTVAFIEFIVQVFKDNRSLFALEVPSLVLGAPNIIITHFSEAAEFFTAAATTLYSSLLKPIILSASFMLMGLYESVVSIKNLFIIIGDSLWLIVTFIPVYLPGIISALAKWLFKVSVDGVVVVYLSVLRVIYYLTDIPLQSTAGIIFAVIMVRLIVDFQVEILSLISRLYRWLSTGLMVYYYAIYNYFMDEEMQIINQLVGNRQPVITQDEGVNEENPLREALCVVCQERQKCMLILPCRHICLCCECCIRLYNYQRTCPICRTFICHSVNVYL